MRFASRACLVLGLLLLAAAAGFPSGDFESGDRVSGSGNVSTENRDVPAPSQKKRVSISGSSGGPWAAFSGAACKSRRRTATGKIGYRSTTA